MIDRVNWKCPSVLGVDDVVGTVQLEVMQRSDYISNNSYSYIEHSAYGVSVSRSIPTEVIGGTSPAKAADITTSVSAERRTPGLGRRVRGPSA